MAKVLDELRFCRFTINTIGTFHTEHLTALALKSFYEFL